MKEKVTERIVDDVADAPRWASTWTSGGFSALFGSMADALIQHSSDLLFVTTLIPFASVRIGLIALIVFLIIFGSRILKQNTDGGDDAQSPS